ncbi:unnamed protein product, partial [Amoebophrya sp. A25]|eukprot:GSA25T00019524001.1
MTTFRYIDDYLTVKTTPTAQLDQQEQPIVEKSADGSEIMITLPKRHKYHSLTDLINMQQHLENISGNHHGLSFNILKSGQLITTQEALQDATLLQRPTSPASSGKSTQQKEFSNIHDYKNSTKVKRQRQNSKIHYHSYETEDEGWR